MVNNYITVCRVVERESASINRERQHVSSAKDQASVSIIGFVLNVSHAKGAESVNMSGSNLRVKNAKEATSANMDGNDVSVKNVVGVPSANMDVTDILAENVTEPGFANMENENRYVVTVEEHPCVNMDANAPSANPAADHLIANITCFVARVSSAHQKWHVSIVVWFMWAESFPDGNPIVFGAIVSSTQTKRFRDDFA
jgi:hypothetical protein